MDKVCFRVSAVDLAESDERALKVFLRFVGNTPNSIWEWSTRDDCDLLLTGNELPRPLHADDFSELLRKVEAAGSRAGPEDPPAMAEAAAGTSAAEPAGKSIERSIEEPIQGPPIAGPAAKLAQRPIERLARNPVGKPVEKSGERPEEGRIEKPPEKPPEKPSETLLEKPAFVARDTARPEPAGMVGTAPPPRLERSGRYRLARWPKSEFLRGRARATRVLSFLASGHLTVQQLCTLSGADRETCVALLDALEAAGYLDVKQAPAGKDKRPPAAEDAPRLPVARATTPPAVVAARPMPAPAPVPRAAAGALPIGLFNRLRRHLGLG